MENKLTKSRNDNPMIESLDKLEIPKMKSEDAIKGMNFFKRLKLIKGTLSKLRERTSFRKFMFVKNHQLKIIHDCTFDGEGRQDVDLLISLKPKKNTGVHWLVNSLGDGYKFIKKLGLIILHYLEEGLQRSIPTIKPNSRRKILWDFFIMFFILFKFFMIPIELSFGIKLHINVDPSFGLVNFITSCFFIIDIFLKMNTGFYDNGNVVLIKSKILKHYFKSYFILDILASVHSGKYIYEYIYTLSNHTNVSSAPWLHFFFFFKLIELMHVVSNLEESVYMSETVEALVELLKLVIKILFYSHLEACLWHATARFNPSSGDNWIEKAGMTDAHWFDRYLVSLFWSVSALITASYGEKVSPQNRLEMIIGVFLLLVGAMVFGFTIKSVGEVLDRLNMSKRSFKSKLRTLNRFMKQKKINYELQDRARKYLHFFLRDRDSENAKRVEEILDKFSFNLKEEIYLNTNGVILQKFPVLKDNFTNEFLKKLVFQMTQVTFIPEETIFQEHDPDDHNLYLITEGFIQLFNENSKRTTLLKKMTAGDSFGEKEFFSGTSRSFSAKSITFSSGYCIKREDFIATIQKFPEDYEKFCMIKDEILVYNETNSLKQKCFACNMAGHDYTQCRKIRYIPYKDFVISRSQFSKPQERDPVFNRKKVSKFNSRFNNREVVNQVQEFLMNASYEFSETITFTEENEGEFEAYEPIESSGDQDIGLLKPPLRTLTHTKTDKLPERQSIKEIDELEIGSDFSITNEGSVGANMNKLRSYAPKIFDLTFAKEAREYKRKRPDHEGKDQGSGTESPKKSESERSFHDEKKVKLPEDKKIEEKHLRKPSIINNFGHNARVYTFDNLNTPAKQDPERKRTSKLGNLFFPLNHVETGFDGNDNFTRKDTRKTTIQRKERKNTINSRYMDGTRSHQSSSGFLNFGSAVQGSSGGIVLTSMQTAFKDDTHTATDTRLRSKGKLVQDDAFIKGETMFIVDFERVKNFSKYFNNNNLDNVMKDIKYKEKLAKKKKLKNMLSRRSLKNVEDFSPQRIKIKKRESKVASHASISTPKKEQFKLYELLDDALIEKEGLA